MLRVADSGLLVVVSLLALPSIGAGQSEGTAPQSASPGELAEADETAATGPADDGWQGLFAGPLRIGGALRVNYVYKDWDGRYDWPGELAFDTARVNLDLDASPWNASLEYRYYRDRFSDGHDYSMLHHAWFGATIDDRNAVQIGVMKVPFGILPYASHNWFFQLPYYVGFEDDYDLGVTYIGDFGGWNLQAAYFARDEGSWVGESDDSARYSYDLVREGGNGNAERGQFNVRTAYTFLRGEGSSTEVGLSLMAGRVKNNNPLGGTGKRRAIAVHLNGHYGRWNVMLQTIRYAFDVENDPNLDASPNGEFVVKGAYDASYYVASKAMIYTAGVAYALPVDWGLVTSLTFYNDFSLMKKDESGYRDSLQNVVGCSVAAGPLFIYVDIAVGRNQPWLGGDWTYALADGGEETGTNTRFNINVGLYF